LMIAFGVSWGIDSKINILMPNISTFSIFLSNILGLFLIQLAVGIVLGTISSLIAVRKYLKI